MPDTSYGQIDVLVYVDKNCSELPLNYFFAIVFGLRTRIVDDPADALRQMGHQSPPKLFVLSIRRVTPAAIGLIKKLQDNEHPGFVLALASSDDAEAVIHLFEAGCTDVFSVPLSLRELAYRFRARASEIGLPFEFSMEQAKTLDLGADIIRRADLTDIEAQIILLLLESGGDAVSRDTLSLTIDNQPWSYGNRKFDVHIASIRKKLEAAFDGELTVHTIRNSGYRLSFSGDLNTP